MVFQAIPHNALLLQKAKKDANIAKSLGELRDFSPEEIEFLSNQGHKFTTATLIMAEDVKNLLAQNPGILSRRIDSWSGWTILHRLTFDNQFNTVINHSPEPIVVALLGRDLIHVDCKATKYIPPDAISNLLQYLSPINESKLFHWFPMLRKRQIAAHSPFIFDEAIKQLTDAMKELNQFYELELYLCHSS